MNRFNIFIYFIFDFKNLLKISKHRQTLLPKCNRKCLDESFIVKFTEKTLVKQIYKYLNRYRYVYALYHCKQNVTSAFIC